MERVPLSPSFIPVTSGNLNKVSPAVPMEPKCHSHIGRRARKVLEIELGTLYRQYLPFLFDLPP